MEAGGVGSHGKPITLGDESNALRNEKAQIEKKLPVLDLQLKETRLRYKSIVEGAIQATPAETEASLNQKVTLTQSKADLQERLKTINNRLLELNKKPAVQKMGFGMLGGLGDAVAKRREKVEGEIPDAKRKQVPEKEPIEEKGEVPVEQVTKRQRQSIVPEGMAPAMEDDIDEIQKMLNDPDSAVLDILNYAREEGIRLNDDQLQSLKQKIGSLGWLASMWNGALTKEVDGLIRGNNIINGCVENCDDSGRVNPRNVDEALSYMLELPTDADKASFMKGLMDQLGEERTQIFVTNMTENILSSKVPVEEKSLRTKTIMRSVIDGCGMQLAKEIVSRAIADDVGTYDRNPLYSGNPTATDFGELLRKNTVARQLLKGFGMCFEKQITEILEKQQPTAAKIQEFSEFFGSIPEFRELLNDLNSAALEFANKRPPLVKNGVQETVEDRNTRAAFETERFVLVTAMLSIVSPIAIDGPPDANKARESQMLQMAAAQHQPGHAWDGIAQRMFGRR